MFKAMMKVFAIGAGCFVLTQCAGTGGGGGRGGNMGGPTAAERDAQISSEPTGDFYYGRRYYVEKTRFWGYLRQPRQSPNRAKLVVFNEDRVKSPDRFSENGSGNQRYGFDNNYEYKIRGNYTGKKVYDPNSNQVLPEFMLSGFEVVNRQPGWLFRPDDRYNSASVTLVPR
jgi:hypothetical protein